MFCARRTGKSHHRPPSQSQDRPYRSGVGWIPFGIEAEEHQFDEKLADYNIAPERRPRDYFCDHLWCIYWFEKIAPEQFLQTIGVNKVLFETDFPQPTAHHPSMHEHLPDTLGGVASRRVEGCSSATQ